MPRVAVILPSFNRAHTVRDTLDSVLAQTFTDFEAVVIDDGSMDKTAEAIASYAGRVRYVVQENRGCAGACNRGIRETTAPYVLILGADDVLVPEGLDLLARALDGEPKAGLAFGDYDEFGERPMPGTYFEKHPPAAGMIAPQVLRQFTLTAACSVMFRRECLKDVGLFDEQLPYAEDVDFWLRFCARYPCVLVPQVISHVRAARNSKHRNHATIVDYYETRARIVERFLDQHPAVASQLASSDLRVARSRPYFFAGVWALRKGERANARRLLQRALALRWTYPQHYWYYLLAFMPTPLVVRFAGRTDPAPVSTAPMHRRTATVIPSWNRREDVLKLLEAVAKQKAAPEAAVVVDNASDDGTADAVAQAAPRAVVLRQEENLGGAGGFNAGMAWALERGFDFAWLLDSDAVPEGGALEPLLDVMRARPEVAVAGSVILRLDGRTVQEAGGHAVLWTGALRLIGRGANKADLPSEPYDAGYVAACSALVRLDAVRKCGAMRGDYFVFYDDVEFSTRMRREGYKIVVAPRSCVRHEFHGDKPKTAWRLYYSLRNAMDFFLRYDRWPCRFFVAVRQFAGAERLARGYERAGGAEQARACRLAVRHAREGVLGRVEIEDSGTTVLPMLSKWDGPAALLRGVVDALRARSRRPEKFHG